MMHLMQARASPSTYQPGVPPRDYLPSIASNFNFHSLPTSFSGGGRRQHFLHQNSGQAAAAFLNGALHARSARGGTLVVPADCHLRAHNLESTASVSAISL